MSAFKDLIRNRAISLLEVEALLNIYKHACMLVDQDDEIVLVNSAFTELTAFFKGRESANPHTICDRF
jgi:hypothetical protein